jgi:photosystem II stability/assembly factor-like uncharacterized protein
MSGIIHRFILSLIFITGSFSLSAQQSGWTLAEHDESLIFYSSERRQLLDCASARHFAAIARQDFWLTVRLSADSGKTWYAMRNEMYDGSVEYRGIQYPEYGSLLVLADSAYFLGYDDNLQPLYDYKSFVLLSRDNGITWETVVPATSRRKNRAGFISMTNARFGLLVQHAEEKENADILWRTANGGNDWKRIPLPDGARLIQKLLCIDSVTYVLLTNNRTLYRTNDGGLNWQKYENIPEGTQSVVFVTPLEGWLAGAVSNGNGHQQRDIIYHTTDGGVTWIQQLDKSIELPFGLNEINFADAQHGIAVGQARKILRTSDGGNTWVQDEPPSILFTTSISAIAYPAPGSAVAVCNSAYVLRFSDDAGLATPRLVLPRMTDGEQREAAVLAWTAVAGATSYEVQVVERMRSLDFDLAEFEHAVLDTVGVQDTALSLVVRYDRQYVCRVRALGLSDTKSDWSTLLTFLTVQGATAPAAPTPVSPVNNANGQSVSLSVEWEKVLYAEQFDFQLADNPQFAKTGDNIFFELFDITKPSASVSGLKPHTLYYWRVRAKNSAYTSLWSSEVYGVYRFTTGENTTDVGMTSDIAMLFTVSPHPVRETAVLHFARPVQQAHVSDLTGRIIADLTPSLRREDDNSTVILWNTTGIPDGMYIVRCRADNSIHTIPVIVRH